MGMIDSDSAPKRIAPLSTFESHALFRILPDGEDQGFIARTSERNYLQRALDKVRSRLGRPSRVTVDVLTPGLFVHHLSDDRGGYFGYFKGNEPSRTLSPGVLVEEVYGLYYGRVSEAARRGRVLLNRD